MDRIIIKEGIEKDDKKTAKILRFVRNFMDPNSALQDLEHNEKVSDAAEYDVAGPKGMMARFLSKAIAWLKPDGPALQLQPEGWIYVGRFPLGEWQCYSNT